MATGVATAAGLLAGCTGSGGRKPTPHTVTAAERAARTEAGLRRRSAAVSAELLAGYDEVLSAHPTLRSRLAPLREATALHVAALAPAGATPAPPPSPVPSGSAVAQKVPADPAAALGRLAALASRTATAHTTALVTAPPELARLLASVAAAGAVHAYLLTEGSRA